MVLGNYSKLLGTKIQYRDLNLSIILNIFLPFQVAFAFDFSAVRKSSQKAEKSMALSDFRNGYTSLSLDS